MAIIYTYPVKTTPNANDLILISDSEDSNKTKQIKISTLPGGSSSGVSSVTAVLPLLSTGGSTPAVSLSGITGFGAAYQVLKVNATADGLYWDTAGVTSNIYTASGTVSGSGSERSLNFSNTKSLVLSNPNSFIIDASNTAYDYNTAMVHVMKQGTSKFAVMQDGRVIINNGGNVTIPSQETSAILHAKSTDKGFLMPTMTGEEVEAISSPATGLKAYATSAGSGDVTSAGTWTYNGSNWISPGTSLVPAQVNTGNLIIGGATSTSTMTLLNTTAKGTIAVGNGSTTTTKAVGTDTHVLTAKSADATGVSWEAITFPTVDLTSGVTGTLPVTNGGTGLATFSQDAIVRGNGTSGLAADSYLTYGANAKSLKIRGTGNTAPSMSAPLSINDVSGTSAINKACIGLTPYQAAQGGNAISIELGGFREGITVIRNNTNSGAAMRFQQTISGSTQVGSITFDGTSTSYLTSSDYRLKENVVDMTGAVDRVKQLKPSRFNFIGFSDTVDGFLAHEAQAVVPESVTGVKDAVKTEEYEITPAVLDESGDIITEAVIGTREVPDYQSIDKSKLVPLLVGAIKELTARIEALEA